MQKLQWILRDLYQRRSPANIKLTLDRIINLCKKLGDPQKKFNKKTVIFTGSNGKFSNLQYLKTILHKQGFSTNCYTSPETIKLNERFEINGKLISDDDFIKYLEIIEKKSDGSETFFEILSAIFFLISADQNADYILCESGLGFKGDCSRIIEDPLAHIITSISQDHRNFLGDLKSIVQNKVEDLSKKTQIIISKQSNEVLKYMDEYLKKNPSKQYYFSEDYNAAFENDTISFTDEESLIHIKRPKYFPNFQLYNLASAIKTAKLISSKAVDPETINYAIENAYLPARFQVISKKNKLSEFVHEEMMLILSASHNEGGAIELRKSLEDLKHKGPIYFVFAMNKSKDLKAFLSQFASLVTEVKAVHFREGFYTTEEIKKCCDELGIKCSPAAKNNAATPTMQLSLQEPGPSVVCITGSIELCGSLLALDT